MTTFAAMNQPPKVRLKNLILGGQLTMANIIMSLDL